MNSDSDSEIHRRRGVEINGSENHQRSLDEQTADGMFIENVRERMQRLQQDVLDQFADGLNDMVTEVTEKIENIAHSRIVRNNPAEKLYNDKKKTGDSGKLPEKYFQTRNSVLTDIFNDVQHLKPIYNVWLIILLALFLHTISNDLNEVGRIYSGFITMAAGLAKFPEVIKLWCLMIASSLSVYVFHSLWAHQRLNFSSNSSVKKKIWDYTWLLIFLVYQLAFLFFPAKAVLAAVLPPPSTLIVVMEQVRMMMKIHAYVRSTSPRVIHYKPHAEGKELNFPGFSKFLYFMFAPTLVYRDTYPRTRTISWRFVVWHFLEVIFVCFFVTFLCERYIFPTYQNHGIEPVTLSNVLPKIFSSILPGAAMLVSGFYCLLHAWMNAWAELLKFGDRVYYKDWWNAKSYDAWYRNWNVVVHDWLYTYLYKDFYEILFPGKKVIAMGAVFFTSALFHEYVLGIGFRLFYPMMFVMFGIFGYPLLWLTEKTTHTFGNVFLWFSLMFGTGILLSTYAMEYFARINCPGFGDEMLDLILPRSWLCNSTQLVSH